MNLDAAVNGLLLGGLYALVAVGLSVVFGVLRLINLAHGEILIGSAYLSYVLTRQLGIGPFATLPLVMVIVGMVAFLVQRYLLTGLLIRGSEGALVATFGISLLLQGYFSQHFGSNAQSLSSSLSTSGFSVDGVETRTPYLVAFVVAACVCLLVHLLLTRTRAGTRVRAAAADPSTAGLLGIDVRRVYAVTFAIAAAITAVPGVLVGVTFSFGPTAGTQYLLTGIAVVVLARIIRPPSINAS